MSEQEVPESNGRIEVAPEVLTTIVYYTTLDVEGVNKMAAVPPDVSRLFRKGSGRDGIILDYSRGTLCFDIYVLMDPHVNVLETSHKVQEAVVEAIDELVGLAVETVNVHVEDVVYTLDETA